MMMRLYILALVVLHLSVPGLVQAQNGIERPVWEEKAREIDYNTSDSNPADQSNADQKAGGEGEKNTLPFNLDGSLSFGKDLTIFAIITGVIILGLVLYLILKNLSNTTRKKSSKTSLEEVESDALPDEYASANALESAIQKAENEENWKLAIRFHYHLTLQTLSENQWLTLKPERTDADYWKALENTPYHRGFRDLVDWFNQAWYSKAAVSKPDYKLVKEAFLGFTKGIQPFKPLSE